jgi:hypothetical protein
MTNLSVLLLLFTGVVLAIIAREVVLFYRWIATLPRIRTIASLDLSHSTSIPRLVVGSSSPESMSSPGSDTSQLPQSTSSFAVR